MILRARKLRLLLPVEGRASSPVQAEAHDPEESKDPYSFCAPIAAANSHSRAFSLSSSITFRRARLIRVWYPRPARWNHASTSASSRSVTGLFTGLYMPAHSSGRYRGRLRNPSEASILATFRGAFARFVTRLRCFILLPLYVHKHGNTYTRTTFHVEHFALLLSRCLPRKSQQSSDYQTCPWPPVSIIFRSHSGDSRTVAFLASYKAAFPSSRDVPIPNEKSVPSMVWMRPS